MDDEFLPDGGIVVKAPSDPRVTPTDKIGVVVVPVPNPLDADKANLLRASTIEDALRQLSISIPLEVFSMDCEPNEIDFRIQKMEDLEEKGMAAQIPVLQELIQRQQDLHKLHESLVNSYRTQRAFGQIFASASEKNALVEALEKAADFFSPEN